ncbi:hypothetical protein JCGZ_20449 [Jatropha curcas]|uniref:NAD(P)H-quinone oxidoreductase subunit S, chloroplastic n=1 Tax=Jatropha curcas TaxID=180498 RepID=A0A067JR68_JATCU|nr:hypothetical protein JCGZ_20449 [Jatropha curcas]
MASSVSLQESSRSKLKPCAKFDLFEILGGRGLCNGEKGIQQELKKDIESSLSPSVSANEENSSTTEASVTGDVTENAFEKELMGLTGGFPGGEKGLKKFLEENPPPKKQSSTGSASIAGVTSSKKPKPPELPLLMPGMIAIVDNPNSPYYKYCGIVQRITDGKAAVLFEGGNWDRLITFRLEELQRREKGPPGKNPRSVIIEELMQKEQQ